MSHRPAVFLDRDGTINVEVDYLSDPADLVLIPGSGAAIAALNRADFDVVIITNQSGIARGLLDPAKLDAIHERLKELLLPDGARIDAIRYCPHHPTIGDAPYRKSCRCRKPSPGMLESVSRELATDLERSWVVGDSLRDLLAGAALGVRGVLVGTGKGAQERARLSELKQPEPAYAEDLPGAVELILREATRPTARDGNQGR